jgi:hypothetical protein
LSEVKVLLSGPDALVRELCDRLPGLTGREVQPLRLPATIAMPQVTRYDGQFAIALGLALLGLTAGPGGLDFLDADPAKVDRVARSRTQRDAIISVGLLATIIILLGVQSWREIRSLEAENVRLNRAIRRIFVEAFPEEKKIVNELAQMTDRLDVLRRERDTLIGAIGGGVHPLWALQVLSETLESDTTVRISSFTVRGHAVQIVGTGNSFESVEQFIERLRTVPQFSSIDLEDLSSSRGSERPAFRLLITVETS